MYELSAHEGTAADYDDFARLFALLEIDDPVPPPEIWARELAPNAIFLRSRGRNVAYAVALRFGTEAHLLHVAVDTAARRRGVGRRLLLAAAERMRAQGCTAMRLNVKVGNDPAIRLYARTGLEVHHRSAVLRLPWSALVRLPARSEVTVRAPLPAEDAALEARHDLMTGQLRAWRELGQGMLVAERDGAHVGFARHTAVGAMPFRAERAAAARALLEAIRPHAPPAATHVQLVIEAQDDLAADLRDAGAVLLFDLFHMRGPVPVSAAPAPA